nr:MAG: hypothetical protein [Bacteriophage sp.]
MSSLYNISNDILRIFNEVEQAEGEITDEQYNELCIKQEELKEKLDSYVKAIKVWQVDEQALKDEKKRFNDRQNVYKNRIERLKKAMLEAVINFGETGKNNKFIELPNVRIFTKNTQSVEINEPRINILIYKFRDLIRELVQQGILYTGEDVDLVGILDSINAQCIAEYGEDFSPFSISDLEYLTINISYSNTIGKLLRNNSDILNHIGKDMFNTEITNGTSKDEIKNIINVCSKLEQDQLTVAIIVNNQSIQFK